MRASGYIRQRILVRITQLLEYSSGRLRGGRLVVCNAVHAKVVLDNVCHCLRVCCRTRTAAPDCVMHLCELVCDSICNVCARGRPAVGP
jgi:hypothetical protein